MAEQSKLSKLLDSNQVTIKDLQRKTVTWFNTKATELMDVSKLRPESLMRGDAEDKSNRLVPGELYMYIYEAKYKDTLPYWDRFPLVFPFEEVKGGFYGLNMHYLPYKLRATLMDRLMEFSTGPFLTPQTRLRFKWGTIKSVSKFSLAHPCVKHYLYSQVRTPFKRIPPTDWATALLLPVEQFQGENKNTVWEESTNIVRRARS